ncbi:MAG TPA: sodium:calcium symporter [bacterium]|nr:sodium:calcium symporter [bacterium]
MTQPKERWATRVGLVLAMAGNAVGLGNFLRFPAQAAQNGGGAFIIPYLVSFVLMGLPLLWVEWAIGRHGGQFGYHSAPGLIQSLGKHPIWKYCGVFGIFTNLAIIAYYTYIESWTLGYVFYSLSGVFSNQSAAEVSEIFSRHLDLDAGSFLNVPVLAFVFFLVTLAVNLWILSRGLSKGIERASRIGMPILLLFAVFLVIRALTLNAGEFGANHDATLGLNFLWQPRLDALGDPRVWLAAAGQIFFTLSVGMGPILVYASYVRKNDDIALNATSAGWLNEFVEVILGGSLVIPIAVAYLGLDWVQSNVGFEMGFRTMPTLFQNWGPVFSVLAGVAWFGLLFFAGITSSLAMGQPVVTFFQDSFGISRGRAVMLLGVVAVMMALPCIFLYGQGAFGEFDYWAGTFSLVVFALIEIIAFAWVFGIDRGWKEITRGADIRLPGFFKAVIKYVTPLFLIAVFIGAVFKPVDSDWVAAASHLFGGNGWPFAPDSIIGTVFNIGVTDRRWFIDGHPTSVFVVDATRIFLLMIFLAIGFVIHVSWRNKAKQRGGTVR